jgi:hypothetical protein
MPSLACWSCGRRIFATAEIAALAADERRCPRCGALLNQERRGVDRREVVRRKNPADQPGPPASGERRTDERRKAQRRRKST